MGKRRSYFQHLLHSTLHVLYNSIVMTPESDCFRQNTSKNRQELQGRNINTHFIEYKMQFNGLL